MAAQKRQKRSFEESKTETDFQINDELMHGSVPMLSTDIVIVLSSQH